MEENQALNLRFTRIINNAKAYQRLVSEAQIGIGYLPLSDDTDQLAKHSKILNDLANELKNIRKIAQELNLMLHYIE